MLVTGADACYIDQQTPLDAALFAGAAHTAA
jgi:hypothetical protein